MPVRPHQSVPYLGTMMSAANVRLSNSSMAFTRESHGQYLHTGRGRRRRELSGDESTSTSEDTGNYSDDRNVAGASARRAETPVSASSTTLALHKVLVRTNALLLVASVVGNLTDPQLQTAVLSSSSGSAAWKSSRLIAVK